MTNEKIEHIDKSPSSIYLMHKYWGKKPSDELRKIIENYTKDRDLILDPFAGYAGIGVEAILKNRDVILNDLNPIANFIANNILEKKVDIDILVKMFLKLKDEYKNYESEWYTYKNSEIITTLRDNQDRPHKIKIKDKKSKKMLEIELNQQEIQDFLEKENNSQINHWYPTNMLIPNSRIGSRDNMTVSDSFPKRALLCHAALFELISKLPDSNEKELLKLAFTSNLANCSKLVPPIVSRGELSQGAWMTGFYIGEKYLENNVFHYFENRVQKIIKGKNDYLNIINETKKIGNYQVTNFDAKDLNIENNTIDFVFTDFPYGDSVPYFEQSQLWNAWLENNVDYENEIVISDSNIRNKNIDNFCTDIEKSISEICRVLRDNSYFVFTFHSIQGKEWSAIANAIAKNDFKFIDCTLLTQKTLPPRQLNRKVTIKGDLVVVYKKERTLNNELDKDNVIRIIVSEIRNECRPDEFYDTNELIVLCVKKLLKLNAVSEKIDFIQIIQDNFVIDEVKGKWRLKNEI